MSEFSNGSVCILKRPFYPVVFYVSAHNKKLVTPIVLKGKEDTAEDSEKHARYLRRLRNLWWEETVV